MPGSNLPNGKQQFIDITGAPLVGGQVYFYQIGTLVPKDTYQDTAQTIPNTNPVILDSRGQAVIFGSGGYRQVLQDTFGNTIWDQTLAQVSQSAFGTQTAIASATTTDLGTITTNNALITGTTTITSFGSSAVLSNPVYLIQFNGALTLTYNAASLILPGAANITTAAGDSAFVTFINPLGYWQVIAYFPVAVGAIGTAAGKNTGTSGATVPLLNGNNTYSGTAEFTKQVWSDEVALSVVANASTPDFSTGNNFTAAISANYTLHNPLNVQAGQSGIIRVGQTGSSLTITWGSAYKAAGGISTVNLSGVGGIDYFAYYVHSSAEVVVTPLLNIS